MAILIGSRRPLPLEVAIPNPRPEDPLLRFFPPFIVLQGACWFSNSFVGESVNHGKEYSYMYSMVFISSTNPDFFLLMKSRLPKMKAYPPRLFLTRSTPSAVELTITSSPRLSMYSFILWYVGSYKYAIAVNGKNSGTITLLTSYIEILFYNILPEIEERNWTLLHLLLPHTLHQSVLTIHRQFELRMTTIYVQNLR